ncbi:MAG: hypothetical protein FD180_4617 [Planctomycetota bacterium]|nr:MAG: hypothetical protein FD180_4617 [Planctomycetota bacterium]
MTLRTSRVEFAVGAFLLLAFAGTVALFVGRGGVENISAPTWRVRAEFGHVPGIHPGTAVRMSGIEIGTVESVKLTPAGRVEVLLSLQETYRGWVKQTRAAADLAKAGRDLTEAELAALRAGGNSVVRIEASPLGTGDAALAISPGGPDVPAAFPEALLASVPESSAITDAFEKLKNFIADLSGPEGGQPGGSLGTILQDNGKMAKQIQEILERIEALLENSRESSAGRLLADEGKLYHEVNATVEQARKAIAGIDESVRRTADGANATLKSVNEALTAMQEDMKRTTEELRRTLKEAGDLIAQAKEKGLLAAVDGPDGELRKRIDAILAEVEKAVADVKAAAAKLPAMADDGGKALNAGNRVVREAGDVTAGAKRHWLLKSLFEGKEDEWIRAWDLGPERKPK